MIASLLYAKLPPKWTENMARLENGFYDEIIAHLERELELNALEESDDLPMATMTSSTSKRKKTSSPMGCHPILLAIIAKKRAIWSKTMKNSRRKKKSTPKKAKRLRKMSTLSVERVARKIAPKNDVDKVQEHISSLNVIGLRTHRTTVSTPKHKNHNTTPHRLVPSPHQRRTSQKTSFITTPTQRA